MLSVKVNGETPDEQKRKHAALVQIEQAPVKVLEFLAELGREYPKSQTKLMNPLTQMMLKKACK
jgi:hypothetical protein